MPAPTMNTAPLTISFTNTSSGDNLSYNWNFGDGQTSTLQNPTHTFQAGAWEVTLTVTNENGSDTTSSTIVALPASDNEQQQNGQQQQQQQQQSQQESFNEQNPGFNAGSGPPNLNF